MKIAVLLTCFNRKEKTLSCLDSLFQVCKQYNEKETTECIDLTVFLVDDGCTDGTSAAIKEKFQDNAINIIQGTGSLYWSGGMCLAWSESMKHSADWDFFLLLNDDVDLLENLFDELLATHLYSLTNFGKAGLYSGITSAKIDHSITTYGGCVWKNKFLGKTKRLTPTGTPQLCHMTHANILLIHRSVVDKIGIFRDVYEHGCSDYDYSIMAHRRGFPTLVSANFCGRCDNDHKNADETKNYILNATLQERKRYFDHPVHSNKDQLTYVRRNIPFRYPIIYMGRLLNLYCPKLYYLIDKIARS